MPNQYGPTKYPLTEERKAILEADYKGLPGQPAQFARRFGVPKWCIDKWARDLHLTRPASEKCLWELTDERRNALVAGYRGRKGQVPAFAAAFGVPPHMIREWTTKLGLRKSERPWTTEEQRYLEKSLPHKTYSEIAIALQRSVPSLRDRAWRCGLSKWNYGYTLLQVAEGFGVAHATARRWVERGWLVGKWAHTDRTEEQGGDMYRFSDQAIRRFVQSHPQAVDPHKFDWLWLADVLFGGKNGIGELARAGGDEEAS